MFSARFKNRADAGKQLSQALPAIDRQSTLVAALPRGGVPVAAQICRARGLPLELIMVRKIGAPGQRELAVGAVVDSGRADVLVNADVAAAFSLTQEDVEKLGRNELPELARRRKAYMGDREPSMIKDKTIIVVDDGVATGASLRAALLSLRRRQAERIVVAVPIAPPQTAELLEQEADMLVCLARPQPFHSVGTHYADFRQVDDDEVIETLRELSAEPSVD